MKGYCTLLATVVTVSLLVPLSSAKRASFRLASSPHVGATNGSANVTNSTGSGSGSSDDGLTPISPYFLQNLYNSYDFLGILEPITFILCKSELELQCLPALANSTANTAFQPVLSQCQTNWCNCHPNPSQSYDPSNGQLICSYSRPHQLDRSCYLSETCYEYYLQCIADWVFGANSGLPQECNPLLECAQQPSVFEDNVDQCASIRATTGHWPGCNHTRSCGFTPYNISVQPVKPYPDTSSSPFEDATMGLTTAIGIIVVVLLFSLAYAVVRHRRAIAEWRAAEDAALLSRDELREATVNKARWYGEKLQVVAPGNADDETNPTSTGIEMEEMKTCGVCGREGQLPYLLLPCRCHWCGCKPADIDGSPKSKKESKSSKKRRTKPQTNGELEHPETCGEKCGSKIEDYLDLVELAKKNYDFLAPLMHATTSAPAEEEERPSRREQSDKSSTTEGACVICLDEKAVVAFYPCRHRATCADCGKRIIAGDAVSSYTQIQSLVRRRRADCQCPLCRTEIDFAVVISTEQLLDIIRYHRITAASAPVSIAAPAPLPDDESNVRAAADVPEAGNEGHEASNTGAGDPLLSDP